MKEELKPQNTNINKLNTIQNTIPNNTNTIQEIYQVQLFYKSKETLIDCNHNNRYYSK